MINGQQLVSLLNSLGKDNIFHANTVSTAISYIRTGGLKSRRFVVQNPQRCFQTFQNSDKLDREFNIDNDIFFDVENIWQLGRICFYGPVVFQYSTAVLSNLENITISRCNPSNWINLPEEERYYPCIEDVCTDLQTQGEIWPIGKHIILHDQESLEFQFLEKIILYMPPRCGDLSNIEVRNNPQGAYEDLRTACVTANIPFEERLMHLNVWQGIRSVGRFYGFRMNVPR